MGSECALDQSHVPDLKSAEQRQSRKNNSFNVVMCANAFHVLFILQIKQLNNGARQQIDRHSVTNFNWLQLDEMGHLQFIKYGWTIVMFCEIIFTKT